MLQPRRLPAVPKQPHLPALGAHLFCEFPLTQGVEGKAAVPGRAEVVETLCKHIIPTCRNGAVLLEGMGGEGLVVDCAPVTCAYPPPLSPLKSLSSLFGVLSEYRCGKGSQWISSRTMMSDTYPVRGLGLSLYDRMPHPTWQSKSWWTSGLF